MKNLKQNLNKRVFAIIAAVILAAICLTGCAPSPRAISSDTAVAYYYADDAGNKHVTFEFIFDRNGRAPIDDAEDFAEAWSGGLNGVFEDIKINTSSLSEMFPIGAQPHFLLQISVTIPQESDFYDIKSEYDTKRGFLYATQTVVANNPFVVKGEHGDAEKVKQAFAAAKAQFPELGAYIDGMKAYLAVPAYRTAKSSQAEIMSDGYNYWAYSDVSSETTGYSVRFMVSYGWYIIVAIIGIVVTVVVLFAMKNRKPKVKDAVGKEDNNDVFKDVFEGF